MADEASSTVLMDENGRVTIPKSAREALNLEGQSAHLRLEISVLDRHEGSENTTKGPAD